jgi:RIO kinase 1
VITSDKDLQAIRKRSGYGEGLRHQSWIAYEMQTLQMMAEAGGDVPEPYDMGPNAILMEYIGEPGIPAPVLNSVHLDIGEAHDLYERVKTNLHLLLKLGRIHADLSAFNILYWKGEITLIDFPQVVLADENPSAWVIFKRDVQRICEYFNLQGVNARADALARTLWEESGRKVAADVHPLHLDAENPVDRKLWKAQVSGKRH